MSGDQISLKTLIEILRNELSTLNLQPLGETFYEEIREYLTKIKFFEKEAESREEKSLLRRKQELVERIVSELAKIRIAKNVILGITGTELPENVPWEEQSFYVRIKLELKSFLQEICVSTPENEYAVVRVLEKIPSFVGIDGRPYGPYNPEDICTIPHRNARIFIIKGVAQLIETFTQ